MINIFKYGRAGISPLFATMVVFFLFNSFALNKLLSRYQATTVLDYSSRFVTLPLHGYRDSWEPMWKAVHYLDESPSHLLYQDLFFRDKVKFQYAPTSLLLIEPFKNLQLSHLIYLMNLVSWLLVCLTAFFTCRIFLFQLRGAYPDTDYPNLQYVLFFILWLYITITFYPVVRSWRLGQIQTFNNFLFTLALWRYVRGERTMPGVLAGLMCALKPQYGLLLVWGLVRKQWNFIYGLACAVGFVLIISLLAYGFTNHLDYLSVLTYLVQHGESFYANQSINGLLHRALFNGNNLVWDAYNFPPYNAWVHAGTLLAAAFLIITSVFIKAGRDRNNNIDTTEFVIVVLSITMASPVAWEHHYGVLLPMFAFVLPLALGAKPNKFLIALLGLAYLLSSNFYQVTDALADSGFNFLQSNLFFGALAFLVCVYVVRRALIGRDDNEPGVRNLSP